MARPGTTRTSHTSQYRNGQPLVLETRTVLRLSVAIPPECCFADLEDTGRVEDDTLGRLRTIRYSTAQEMPFVVQVHVKIHCMPEWRRSDS